jgi:hypothetical protein
MIQFDKGGLLSRLRRIPGISGYGDLTHGRLAIAEDLISAVEIRALWSRFGL